MSVTRKLFLGSVGRSILTGRCRSGDQGRYDPGYAIQVQRATKTTTANSNYYIKKKYQL